jgi:hypothetical protein
MPTANDIQAALGEVDTFTIERILETGASIEEITEARAELDDERRFGEYRPPSSPRVVEVREILEQLDDEDDDEH